MLQADAIGILRLKQVLPSQLLVPLCLHPVLLRLLPGRQGLELSRHGIELLGKRLHPVPTGLMPVSDRMNQVLPRLHLVIGRLQSIPIGMKRVKG